MARYKVAGVLILMAALLVAVSGLTFEVDVEQTIQAQDARFQYDNGSVRLQELNVSATNTGSVTCGFRMKARFERANQTITRYSTEQIIYPGEEQLLELEYLPYNYTGPVRGRAWVQYCGQEASLGNLSFTVDERLWTNNSLTSRTVRVSNDSATVELPVEQGIMVPEKAPGYWRPSAARITNGTAVVRYDPPLFDPRESLEYTVYDPQAEEVLGTVTVGLHEELTLVEQLRRNGRSIALALSGLLNIILGALLYRRRGRSTSADAGTEDA